MSANASFAYMYVCTCVRRTWQTLSQMNKSVKRLFLIRIIQDKRGSTTILQQFRKLKFYPNTRIFKWYLFMCLSIYNLDNITTLNKLL